MDQPVNSQALENINPNPIQSPKLRANYLMSSNNFQVFFCSVQPISYINLTLLYKLEWEKENLKLYF